MMSDWDNAMTMLAKEFEEVDTKEKREIVVVGNEYPSRIDKATEEQQHVDFKPLVVTTPICVAIEALAAFLYFNVNEGFGLAIASSIIPTLFWTASAVFHPKESRRKRKKKTKNLIKEGGLFRSMKDIEDLLEDKDNKKLAKQLKQIRKKAIALGDIILTQSQYELFIQTRLEMYITPYLEYISDHKGKLNKDDRHKMEEVFGKLEVILDGKREEIESNRDSNKKVEMKVVEQEIDNALLEYRH